MSYADQMTRNISEFPKHPLPQIPAPQRAHPHAPTVFVYEKQEWEYRIITKNIDVDALQTEQDLNPLGKDGWELVGITTIASIMQFYLKRIRN